MDVVTLKIATDRSVPRHTRGHAVYYRDEQGRERPVHPSRIAQDGQTMYLYSAAGRFNFSWNNATGRLWTFPAGTVLFSDGVTPISTSTAQQPDVIIPAGGGVVTLQSAAWAGNFTLNDNNTDSGYLGSLADLPALTYHLDLTNCSLVTGDLSDLPALTFYLILTNCSLVTGSLADLPAVTNYLILANCNLVTGSLADLPALTNFLDLYNCSLVTGSLADLPALTNYLNLYNCSLVTGSLADLPAVTNFLDLSNCSLVTGSLADLPALTNYLILANCNLVTGSLADLPALTYHLILTNCSLVTGAYTAVSGTSVPTTTILTGTGMSATDMDATLIAYAATTKNGGTFTATGKTRTAASDAAVTTLTSAPRNWTISGITKV